MPAKVTRRERERAIAFGGSLSPESWLVVAQANLLPMQSLWNIVAQAIAKAQQPGQTGWADASLAPIMQIASGLACEVAHASVMAARGFAARCQAAANAAAGASECASLDLSGEQGTPWGVVWNGQANVLDRIVAQQVQQQVQRAAASLTAAQQAKSVACPLTLPSHLRPLKIGHGASGSFGGLDIQTQAVFTSGPGQQLQAEGWDQQTIDAQANVFADQYNALVGANPGVDVSKLATAAASYVGLGSTFSGAQQIIGGLIGAAQSGDTSQVINSFTGVAIGAVGVAIAAGAATAGVGAAIVAGLELVSSLVGNLFQTPAPTAQVAGCGLRYTPSFVIPGSEVWCNSPPTPAGPSTTSYSRWRKFPNPNEPKDEWWFSNATGVGGDCGAQSWANAGCVVTHWDHGNGWNDDEWVLCGSKQGPAWRPIDGACFENGSPVYAQLESDNLLLWIPTLSITNPGEGIPALQKLQQAFFAAWKANREYDFNGLGRQSDWQVLQQVILRFNLAHEPGNGVSLPVAPFQPLTYGSPPNPIACYMQMVLNDLQSKGSSLVESYDPSTGRGVLNADGSIHVNTGPLKMLPIHLPPPIHLHPPAGASSRGVSLKQVAVGAAVAAGAVAAGVGVWAFTRGVAYTEAWGQVWHKLVEATRSSAETLNAPHFTAPRLLAGDAKYERCVRKVRARGSDANPFAVCAAVLPGHARRRRRRRR
jgi:hypothetical protein